MNNISDTIPEMAYFTGIDYSVLIVMLSFSLSIGIYFAFFSKKLKTVDDYLVGGHQMKSIPIAISLVASQLSALSIVAVPAEIYSYGWQYLLIIPCVILIMILVNFLFLPVFYHNNIENCYFYLELRFGSVIRNCMTVIFVLLNCFYLPVIMYIPSLSFVEVTKLNIHMVNTIICYICVFYTMLGGIQAVVWTDVLQGTVMILSVMIVAIFGIVDVGGLNVVWDRAVNGSRIFPPDFTLDLETRTTFWNTIAGIFGIWLTHIGFSQSCVQRLVSLPSLASARKSMVYFAIGVSFILIFTCGSGIIMYAYYYDCDPVSAKMVSKYDKLMPRFVQDVTGHIIGMSGIFISCVFSASLSTISAVLHSISGIIYNDYIRPRKWFAHTDPNANLTMRIIIFVMGTFCALSGIIVERFESIFQMVTTVGGMFMGATFGVFTFGMLYPWGNKQGALSGMVVSTAAMFCIILNAMQQSDKIHYERLPMSTYGCPNETLASIDTIQSKPFEMEKGFAFYKIAFQWYPFLGVIFMWIPAAIVSYLTGGQDFTNFNIKLLAPCIQHLMPKKYRHTEMKVMSNGNKSQYNRGNENSSDLKTEWIFQEENKNELGTSS